MPTKKQRYYYAYRSIDKYKFRNIFDLYRFKSKKDQEEFIDKFEDYRERTMMYLVKITRREFDRFLTSTYTDEPYTGYYRDRYYPGYFDIKKNEDNFMAWDGLEWIDLWWEKTYV